MFRAWMAILPLTLLLQGCSATSGNAGDELRESSSQEEPVSESAHSIFLFRVSKDENANYVVYDVIVDEKGRLAEEPLDAYWIMAAGDGQRAELNRMEQGVYGTTIVEVDRASGRMTFKVNGVDSKPIDVELVSAVEADMAGSEAKSARAYMTIDGQRAKLLGVHLVIVKTLNPLRPKVDAQLTGRVQQGDKWVGVGEVVSK